MGRKRDPDTGQYVENYREEEILSILEGTRLSTPEVAEQLDCDRTTAHERLGELRAEEKLVRDTVGGAFMWALPSDE